MALLKKLVFPGLLFTLLFLFAKLAFGDECPPCTPDSSQDQCQRRISCLSGQKQLLSSQIELIDTQIKVTQSQINSTQEKIDRLTGDITSVSDKITSIEGSLAHVSEVLSKRITETYIAGRSDPMLYLLGSADFSDFWQRLEYLRIAQKHDKNLIIQMAQTRKNYNDQKDLLQNKKSQVETLSLQLKAYKAQLNQQNKEKQALLAATQEQLDQAIAQLAAFQNFVQSQGGASLLSNQTKCDDWGCYYNQRDSSWGANSLNHTGYTLANSGCLVTSMAMVATHYGRRDVNPQTINGVSSNFAIYAPYYLNYPISAGGANFLREKISSSYSPSQIDSELSAGHPVVVGIDSGPAHFVVLVSGSNGNYLMNDPFVENGGKIPFTSKYFLSRITEVDKVSMN